MKNLISIFILSLSGSFAFAQSIFDIALKNINTEQSVTLKEYNSSKGMVIVFMSTKCPYAKYYELRLQAMANNYRDKGISFLMINSNSSEPNDLIKSQAKTINARYLLDSSKELADLLGAKKSPEAFLLRVNGSIHYSGAIDDNPQVADDVQVSYLKNAIDGFLSGNPSLQDRGRPVGCMIK